MGIIGGTIAVYMYPLGVFIIGSLWGISLGLILNGLFLSRIGYVVCQCNTLMAGHQHLGNPLRSFGSVCPPPQRKRQRVSPSQDCDIWDDADNRGIYTGAEHSASGWWLPRRVRDGTERVTPCDVLRLCPADYCIGIRWGAHPNVVHSLRALWLR